MAKHSNRRTRRTRRKLRKGGMTPNAPRKTLKRLVNAPRFKASRSLIQNNALFNTWNEKNVSNAVGLANNNDPVARRLSFINRNTFNEPMPVEINAEENIVYNIPTKLNRRNNAQSKTYSRSSTPTSRMNTILRTKINGIKKTAKLNNMRNKLQYTRSFGPEKLQVLG